jgi:hypothetical protein
VKRLASLLLWAALLAALVLDDREPLAPEPRPCGVDVDCCLRNPRTCAEADPVLYRETWGKP